MAGHLLDTDTSIFWLRQDREFRRRVEANGGLKRVYVSAITAGKLMDGAFRSPDSVVSMAMTEKFIRQSRVLPYDRGAARRYGAIKSLFEKFDPVHNLDLMNALIALERGVIVVTNNTRHYQHFKVMVENWTIPRHGARRRCIRVSLARRSSRAGV